MLNFKQVLHLQETKENLQNILINNFLQVKLIAMKPLTNEEFEYQATFNLGYLLSSRKI